MSFCHSLEQQHCRTIGETFSDMGFLKIGAGTPATYVDYEIMGIPTKDFLEVILRNSQIACCPEAKRTALA